MKKAFSVFLCLFIIFSFVPAGRARAAGLTSVPPYTGEPCTVVNNGIPFFTEAEKRAVAFERYPELDSLGRCSAAFACVCVELMPTEERGTIGSVRPSGWQLTKYDFIDGKYLFNRCHLIGYQLTGENANVCNLITGTRYMNVQGMLPYENKVAEHVRAFRDHVLYRVTPVFRGDELVARGVLMEAYSVEDNGRSVCFCVFCHNVQPGVTIDYADGTSRLAEEASEKTPRTYTVVLPAEYTVNVSSGKYHLRTCKSVAAIKEKNRRDVRCTFRELAEAGYSPCAVCEPDKAAATGETYLYGDVNKDGRISAYDARLVLRTSVGLDHPDELSRILSDVDWDGEVTAHDARIVLRVVVGLQIIA